MITPEDISKIVHALQAADVRPNLTFCLVMVDVEDQTITTSAPEGVDKRLVLKAALDSYDSPGGPDDEFDIHPAN
jgi:hypothetical protein